MIKIKQLTNCEIETVYTAFLDAFADYVEPIIMTQDQLAYLLERRGCDFNLSFGAFDDDKLVGFIVNGVGNWNGKRTAYDTGTGVIKKYRRQGLASRIFEESVPILKEHGIEQYILEVIRTNTGAADLYRKSGFEISREFDYYDTPLADITFPSTQKFQISKIQPDWDLFATFWDYPPSWQNSIDSINRKRDFFTFLGITIENKLIGYGVIERHTGDIPQFAVRKDYRRQGCGSALIQALVQHTTMESLRIINADIQDETLKKFLNALNLKPGFGQYEMTRQL